MAVEPATLKSSLGIAAVLAMGPVVGEYAIIVLGSFFGAILALQLSPVLRTWLQACGHVANSMIAGVLFGGAASVGIASLLPSWGSPDLLWFPLPALIAMFWRNAADIVPKLLQRWAGKDAP